MSTLAQGVALLVGVWLVALIGAALVAREWRDN